MPHSKVLALHVDFALPYLIAKGRLLQPRADRRLNALENVIWLLSRSWRPERPVMPRAELRMNQETLSAYIGWVQAEQPARGDTAIRLKAYKETVDVEVPDGWVRLLLGASTPGM
jgi:hypothetical protein